MSLRLDSTFVPPPDASGGAVRLRLVNAGQVSHADFALAFTSMRLLTPPESSDVRLLKRLGSYHEIAPAEPFTLTPGGVWDIGPLEPDYQLVHANDGPVNAFLIAADGSTTPVHAVTPERAPRAKAGTSAPAPLRLDASGHLAATAWGAAAACEARLFPDDAPALDSHGRPVRAALDESLGHEEFWIEPDAGDPASDINVVAGSTVALQWAFMTLARRQRGEATPAGPSFRPRHGFRDFMIDLSRHFHPAADVSALIDECAWRRLNRIHLHLTDDQGWRLPSTAYPQLVDVGAWRGHGLPLPPAHYSGAEAYGGSYTVAEIRGWVEHAGSLGIRLIPEIDVPGHSHAAVAALPELRDPDESGSAMSVHAYVDNVLNPGVAATWSFLENVFGELADLFPAPWLHIGCDEVPDTAWVGSPAAQRYAAERGVEGSRGIEAAFMRDIVQLVTRTTGRQIGVWEEAALNGALLPDEGYAVGWKGNASCEKLAAAGYQVIAAPADGFYLDMAMANEWYLPGMFWAGWISAEHVTQYDLDGAWSDAERANIAGIEACLWTEHVPDRATMRRLLGARLDAFGDIGW